MKTSLQVTLLRIRFSFVQQRRTYWLRAQRRSGGPALSDDSQSSRFAEVRGKNFSKPKSSPETFSKVKSDKKQNRKFEVSLFNVTRPNFNYQTVFQSFFREPQKFGVRLVFATQKMSKKKLKRDRI